MRRKILDVRRYSVEIKLGVFFLAALVLFFIAIISIREVSFFKGTYLLKVTFNFAEGLKPASPVRFCGVDVGEVRKLLIKEEKGIPIVYVHAKVAQGTNIPRGSKFFINNLSLFGEKYLEIIPHASPATSYVRDGETVKGVDSPPLFDIMNATHQAMVKLDNFIKDSDVESLGETIANINEITREIKGLVIDIKNKEGTVGRLLYDDSIYRKTDEFLGDLKANPWKLLYKPKEKRIRK